MHRACGRPGTRRTTGWSVPGRVCECAWPWALVVLVCRLVCGGWRIRALAGDLEAVVKSWGWEKATWKPTCRQTSGNEENSGNSQRISEDGRVGEGINVERRHGLQGALMHMGKLAIADILLQ